MKFLISSVGIILFIIIVTLNVINLPFCDFTNIIFTEIDAFLWVIAHIVLLKLLEGYLGG